MKIEIVTYTASRPDQPGPAAFARILMFEKGRKPTFDPVLVPGKTAAEAEINAGEWWDKEQAKIRAVEEAHERRAAGRRKALEAKGGAAAATEELSDDDGV